MIPREYRGLALSYGAGVNSTALAILLIEGGWHEPIVFCDTGAEYPETYSFLRVFTAWLADKSLELITIKGMPYQRYRQGVSLIEACEHSNMIPHRYPRWCTAKYKVRPFQRWLKAQGGSTEYLVGIALDENHRAPHLVRPLVEWGVTRADCRRIIDEAELPMPIRSRCWICPLQTIAEWRELYHTHPDLFDRAEEIERASGRQLDSHGHTLGDFRARFESQPRLL